ncbi:MAG: hypothetical protein K9N46_11125 [Candidatus Marinimicrobia bacterium]|nr:hypothetical protein [Candidatus Neomarinimicrobiota bacterium]MCF7827666.1 hypothetical protein [Candidatus Neomarinimicrobiota bacterium]MCF7881279.1 hypothetical protein [Candidatus Neomarinimicrobiota bacterium]
MYKWCVFFTCCLLWHGICPGAEKDFRILFTSNCNGEIEYCQCPEKQYGALDRRAQFITQYVTKHPDAIILDNGDNFLYYTTPEQAELINKIFQLIPYDVTNVGDQDLAFGGEAFIASLKMTRQPRVLTRGDTKISVLRILHPATTRFYPDGRFPNVELPEPDSVIGQWCAKERKSGKLLILLSHSGYEQDTVYASAFPEIDLIVGGHSQTVIDTLNFIRGVAVQQAGGNGEYVGEIRFSSNSSHYIPSFYRLHPMEQSIPAHPRVQSWLNDYHERNPKQTR